MFGLLCMLPIAPVQVFVAIHMISQGMAVLVYLICGTAMAFTANSYIQLSRVFPVAGAGYAYVQQVLDRRLGFLVGWAIVMDYLTVSGLLPKFSTIFLSIEFPVVGNGTIKGQLAMWGVISLFVLINAFFVAMGGTLLKGINYVMLYGQYVLIGIFLVCGVVFVVRNGMSFSLAPLFNANFQMSAIAAACSVGLLGFLGFDSIGTLAEEAIDKVNGVGRAIYFCLIWITLGFIAQGYVASLAHPNTTDLDPDLGFFTILGEVAGSGFMHVYVIVAVLAIGIGNSIPVYKAASNIIYALSRDNTLPFSSVFGKLNAKTRTPVNAVLLVSILALPIAGLGDLNFLSQIVNFGAMITYLAVGLGCAWYFIKTDPARTVGRVWKQIVAPLIGVAIIIFIFTGFGSETWIIGGSWFGLGVLILAFRYNYIVNSKTIIQE